ncbi:MAG: retropepsin-like domain-containing protein, partial [Pyrinomonadaceae bacterium]|nr:retropepsin-like domain-containing protein [Pyrinomonadaceae bacterium]
DGYVGLSIIAKYLSILDYQSRVMTLMRDGERAVVDVAATTPGLEMPIRTTSSGFWSGEVQVDGIEKPLNFIMDTGASISVVSEALAEREEMNRYAQQTKLKVYGAAGVANDVQMLLLPRITLGSQARKNVPAAVLDLNPINETSGFEQTGIIGGNVLRHFRVTFDFQRAVVRLDPPRPPAPPANPASQSFVGRPQS